MVKKFCSLSLFVLILSSHVVAQYSTDQKRVDFYVDICKQYAPDAYEILMADEKNSFLEYANNEETVLGLLDRLNTVVHETCHGYNSKIGRNGGWNVDGYFITKGVTIAARQGSYFPASVLNNVIPKEFQKKIFRYETYVSGASYNTSSAQGVYGFVDEFGSYYHGSKVDLEMLPFYETICPYSEVNCWVSNYLGSVQSTLYAYYEFRLFIAWYLTYAEKHESKVFQELMANNNLRVAFTLLDDQFKQLVDDYFHVRERLIAKLTKAGAEIELNDEYIYVVTRSGDSYSKSGSGIPDNDIAYLKSIFTVVDYDMLNRFRVSGVNLANYQRYIQKL